ncbi:MAG: hypothetical protein ISQ92_02920 [Pelagibacteraceae bacterium]|mgnify:CR=1 FL=1|jgi:hypothetical protein|nr:hypothetical protein [Pelagibacteraceae bacterium]
MFLKEYKKNIFSQNGEDGIILEILSRLNLLNKKNNWCCEFGAWDGKHGSNTFNLIRKYNFNAVYIEGNKEKFSLLKKFKKQYFKVICFNKYISHRKNSPNLLDKVLLKTKIKKNFEILSIDIDSYDLAVWDSVKKYNPIIVIIEINSSLKPGVYQTHSKLNQGNSFSSTLKVAKKKGYNLVTHTGNCIFIRKNLSKKIYLPDKYIKHPIKLFDYSWLNKKENFIKTLIKNIFPNFFIQILRKIKFSLT